MSRSRNEAPDPPFLEELKKHIQAGEAPLPKLPKEISKKPLSNFDREAWSYTFILHGLVVLYMLVKAVFPNLFVSEAEVTARLRALEQKSAIRVDVVGLPTLKRDEIEKLDLTQEATKAPGKTGPEETTVESKPEPSKDAMKLPDGEKAKGENQSREDMLKAARERLRKERTAEEVRQALLKKMGGGKDEGRAAVEGNIVSKGYAASGSVATEMDAYQGQLRGHIRRFWDVPSWMNATTLKARILVKLSFDGRIVYKEFLSRSGNEEFDRYVEKTIMASEPFPAPPELLKKTILEEGVEWGFPQ